MNTSKIAPSLKGNAVSPVELGRLKVEYDQAEKINKEVEEFWDEAGIPGLNELRYAGYHLLKATTGNSKNVSDNMVQAINHCRRASYEASEAGILAALEKIKSFKAEYRMVAVTKVLSDWPSILVDCDNALGAITAARQNGDDRDFDHNEYEKSFRSLQTICSRLEHSRDELNILILEDEKTTRRFVWGTLFAVVAILVAILGIIIAI